MKITNHCETIMKPKQFKIQPNWKNAQKGGRNMQILEPEKKREKMRVRKIEICKYADKTNKTITEQTIAKRKFKRNKSCKLSIPCIYRNKRGG